jgi:hypothetical protein
MRPENCGGGVCAPKCAAMSKRANKISFRISIHQLVPSSVSFHGACKWKILDYSTRHASEIHRGLVSLLLIAKKHSKYLKLQAEMGSQ